MRSKLIALAAAAVLLTAGGIAVAGADTTDPCDTAKSDRDYMACRFDRIDQAIKDLGKPSATPSVTASPSQTPSGSPKPSATPTPTQTPSPTPTSTGPAGEFPNASNTGVPAGTSLTTYSGPCTITAANTIIDGKNVTCDLNIRTTGVTVRNSRIRSINIDDSYPNSSFVIVDSEVFQGDRVSNGIGKWNFTATRVEVTGGNRSIWCERDCTVQDSWVHGQMSDETGVAHIGGIRMGQRSKIIHNTIVCDAPEFPPDAGCSADLTGYGDFTPIQDNLIQNNFFGATTGGFCAYGGSSKGKPYSNDAANIRFIDNIFERGRGGKCGYWGPITDFDRSRPGNAWTGNKYDDGTPVTP